MSEQVAEQPAAEVKHPDVHVQLTGEDGNIFAIMGRVRRALRRADVPTAELDAYSKEVMDCASYDEALQVTMRWVSWS